jgi:opacity protein-like surface antigen
MKKLLFCALLIILFSCPAFAEDNEPPMIVEHPMNWVALNNTTAEFSVAVTGTAPFAYQWQRSKDGGNTWSDISGANAANYSFTAQSFDNGDCFRVVVSNSDGSVTSNIATLKITYPTPPPEPGCNSIMAGGGTFGMIMLFLALWVNSLRNKRKEKNS